MKKSKGLLAGKLMLLVLGVVVIQFSGCKSNHDMKEQIDLSQREISDYLILEEKEFDVASFCGDIIIAVSHEGENVDLYRQDIADDPFSQNGYVFPEERVLASGDSLLMGTRYYYTTGLIPGTSGNGFGLRQILKYDTMTGKQTIVDSKVLENDDRPFVYLAKLDEQQFLSCEINAASSVVKLHDSETDQVQDLIVNHHARVDGVIQGSVIVDACASDNRIFVLINEIHDSVVQYYIQEYNVQGELICTYRSGVLNDCLTERSPLGMYSIGNYILLRNWDANSMIFALDGESLVPCVLPSDQFLFITTAMDNFYFSEERTQYVYLLKQYEDPDDSFYVYDLENKTLRHVKMSTGDPEEVIKSILSDEFGNVIVRFNTIDDRGLGIDPSYYYFSSEEIQNYISHHALQ